MSRPSSDARDRVLTTAARHLKRAGISGFTLDEIAEEAGCAKGLITYHFGSKDELIHAATEEILRGNETQWLTTLRADSFETAVRQTWQTLLAEVRDGYWRAWLSLAVSRDKVIVQLVSNHAAGLSEKLQAGIESQFRTMGLEPTVTVAELGQFLAVGLQGLGLQLATGVKPELLEGAHSALWVAVLGMTRPAGRRGS
ncbi:MAG: TetR/AcrR family transcriptional regulator [Gemmatimonadetes bacterium]|nr:TetR/AcrR family transcriptional regulator [Gemmatimonadota bacterium]